MARRRRAPKRRRTARRRPMARPMVREEMKTLDLNPGVVTNLRFSIDGAAGICDVLLNKITQGTSSIQRVGKKVMMKALQIRGYVKSGSSTEREKASLLLVYIRSNNLDVNLPSFSELMTNRGTTALTNRDNASKYKVLRRWDFTLTGNTTLGTPTTIYSFDEYVVFKKPLLAMWKGSDTSGTIGNFEKGSLHLMCLGDTADAGTARPTIDFESRLYFCECEGYMY